MREAASASTVRQGCRSRWYRGVYINERTGLGRSRLWERSMTRREPCGAVKASMLMEHADTRERRDRQREPDQPYTIQVVQRNAVGAPEVRPDDDPDDSPDVEAPSPGLRQV